MMCGFAALLKRILRRGRVDDPHPRVLLVRLLERYSLAALVPLEGKRHERGDASEREETVEPFASGWCCKQMARDKSEMGMSTRE